MSLIDLLRLLKHRWYVVVLLPLLFGGAAAGYAWGMLPDEYTASVNLYVLTKTTDSASGEESVNMSLSQQVANDISVLIESERVTGAAASSLGLDSLEDFEVEVKSASSNRVVTVTVTGENPDSAARVADRLADEVAKVAVETIDLQAVNIVDRAKTPTEPSGPGRMRIVAAAILAGLCAAVIGILAANALDTTVKSTEEAEELFGYPVLGSMPDVGKEA